MLHRATVSAFEQVNVVLNVFAEMPVLEADLLFSETRVGSHLRHVYDHFQAVLDGIAGKVIDYNKRNRNGEEETNVRASQLRFNDILLQLESMEVRNSVVVVISEIDCVSTETSELESTFDRELLYLINHTIHHMAYVKLVLKGHDVHLPVSVGVAPSTASYIREQAGNVQQCAQ